MAAVIYSLCALTAAVCTYLLIQAYRRGKYRLLLWSGICFAGLTLNNLLLVFDKLVFPDVRSLGLADVCRVVGDGGSSLWSNLGCGMMEHLTSVLMGAVAMASFVATLFFFRFWRQTRDSFFLLFAVAFGIDAATRLLLGISTISNEIEPMFYLARLVTFALIIIAIIQKNRPSGRGP